MNDSLTYDEHRSSIIKTSWRRCEVDYGLDKGDANRVVMLTQKELKDHHEAAFDILSGSMKVIESVRHLAKQGDYCVLVADQKGVAIKGYADTPQSSECADKGLLPGSKWDETQLGTNGIGTALKTQQSITVSGHDHYTESLKNFTCSAAPIFAPDGSILGAIDISRLTSEDFVESFFTHSFIHEAAKQISANIFLSQFNDHNIIALSPSSMVTIYESKALMAIDGNGQIKGATQDCLQLLDQMNHEQLIGQSTTDVFPLTLEELYSSQYNPTQIKEGVFENIYVKGVRGTAELENASQKKSKHINYKAPKMTKDFDELQRFAGSDRKMQRLVQIGRKLIKKDISLLMLGETGVGKDTFSKLLHQESARAGKPFVAVNCAAIPETLMDSELFGYKPGTFTDGLKDGKKGKILASDGGTLFLDEIGDMPLNLQAHLLRVLEEREVTPLGAVEAIPVDIRVICATHKNIFKLVEQGLFRQDLLYRIRGAQIEIPSLRERTNIREVVEEIIRHQSDYDYENVTIEDDVWGFFESYDWPGNIRELRSALMYALCLSDDLRVTIDDLPDELVKAITGAGYGLSEKNNVERSGGYLNGQDNLLDRGASHQESGQAESSLYETNFLAEARHIEEFLKKNNWNVSATAQALGISRSTLHRKIKKYEIIAPNKLS